MGLEDKTRGFLVSIFLLLNLDLLTGWPAKGLEKINKDVYPLVFCLSINGFQHLAFPPYSAKTLHSRSITSPPAIFTCEKKMGREFLRLFAPSSGAFGEIREAVSVNAPKDLPMPELHNLGQCIPCLFFTRKVDGCRKGRARGLGGRMLVDVFFFVFEIRLFIWLLIPQEMLMYTLD